VARLLITGSRGFIGSHAMRYFSRMHDVIGYDYDANHFPETQGFDWVMHFGAISSTNERDVEKVLTQNLDFSIRLFDACRTSGTNLQFSSSASIYGRTDHFREDGPVDPQSVYAWSKYLFERHVRGFEHDIIVQCFRYFNVYGSGEDHKTQPSPHSLFRRQSEISVFRGDDGRVAQRDFVPVENIIQTQERFLDIPESGVWNIGTGQPQTFREVADKISKETGARIDEKPLPEELSRQYQWYTCADLTKLNETLRHYATERASRS
jgi:ADP-L-glycero-D-manno-heptose 6-epimerase